MSEILYGRRYRVIVGSINVSELRCTFHIEKNIAETPNYSEVAIYNLAPATENRIIETGSRVVVEAGYVGSHYGLIFDGDVVQPLRGREGGTDFSLTLVAQDGDGFINSGFVSQTWSAGQSMRTVAENLCGNATSPASIGQLPPTLGNTRLARGKVVFGLARDYLHQIARTEQAAFYCDNGKVNIIRAADVAAGRVITLTPQTGLLGTAEMTEEGVTATCLLNPLLTLNSLVHIDKSFVRLEKARRDSQPTQPDYDGIYRIIKLVHEGDTQGNVWETQFTAVAQTGAIPNTGGSMR